MKFLLAAFLSLSTFQIKAAMAHPLDALMGTWEGTGTALQESYTGTCQIKVTVSPAQKANEINIAHQYQCQPLGISAQYMAGEIPLRSDGFIGIESQPDDTSLGMWRMSSIEYTPNGTQQALRLNLADSQANTQQKLTYGFYNRFFGKLTQVIGTLAKTK